jgi:ribosome-associated heat shock protein Hsp15
VLHAAYDSSAMERVRIDRWLWAARFFKTRGAATDAVLGGRVHLNGARVKPSKEVQTGDRLAVTVGATRRELVVRGLAEKRGPASVAAALYEETPESVARREQLALEHRLARPLGSDLGARPTKRDKRRLDALRAQLRSRRPG